MDVESSPHPMPAAALKRAVQALGSQVATAKLLGVTQGAVSKWLREGKASPPEHVLALEAATRVSRHDLRPDLYPRDSAANGQIDRGVMEPAR